jgi:hypothetical protein
MAHPLASLPVADERASVAPAEVLVIVAHPQIEQSRANRRLMQTCVALQKVTRHGSRSATCMRSIPTT